MSIWILSRTETQEEEDAEVVCNFRKKNFVVVLIVDDENLFSSNVVDLFFAKTIETTGRQTNTKQSFK